MTHNDLSTAENDAMPKRGLFAFIWAVVTLFLIGVLIGIAAKFGETGSISTQGGLVFAGVLLTTLAAAAFGFAQWRKRSSEPESTSERKSRNIYYISMGLGAVLGVYIMLSGGAELDAMFSNNPIDPVTAIVAILVWVVAVPIITLIWWRTTDEHEIAAYSYGASAAFHVYIFLVPSLWMATRAGWLPSQDPMIVWAAAMLIWSAAWLYKKYA